MIKKIIVSIIILFVPLISLASEFTGKISDISSGSSLGTILIIAVNGSVTNKESCNDNSYWDYSINTQDPGANTWVSMILLAFSAGKVVVLRGAGTCNNYARIEDLSNIRVKN